MKRRLFLQEVLLTAGMLGVLFATAAAQAPRAKAPPPRANLNDVSLEIAALQTLHELELTTSQLTALGKLAHDSAPEAQTRTPAKASPECTKAFTDLHVAYARGDDNLIADRREKLDALMEKEEPELDNGSVITEGARGNAGDALKILNVRQVGIFLGTLELTDPAEFLHSAVETVRTLKSAKEVEEETATVAEEVGWLLNGDTDDAQKTKTKTAALLQRAGKLKLDNAYNAQRKSLEKEIHDIIGDVDAMTVIGNILDRGTAELLSNPRLEAAIRIQSRLAARRPAKPAVKTGGKAPGK